VQQLGQSFEEKGLDKLKKKRKNAQQQDQQLEQ